MTDPRLLLPEDQRRGAAGVAGRKKLSEAERKRRLAAARAERERRRRAKAEAERRAREAAAKRTARSREVAAESKPEPTRRAPEDRVHGRDKIEHYRSYGDVKRGRPAQPIENVRARTTAERELLSRDEAARRGAQAQVEAKMRAAGIGPRELVAPAKTVRRHVKKAARDLLYGTADMAADYGTALYGDLTETDVKSIPFRRTGRQVAKDALGLAAFAETAIPEPKFLPEWMKREVLEVDPENLRIGRGSGKVDPDDAAKAAAFWKENPILGALGVLPVASAVTRGASRGAIAGSVRAANPKLSAREARRIAARESRMPGRGAAHGIEGGIAPRVLRGEAGEAVARPWSRHPIGRAGQRAFDRASQALEERLGPGVRFGTSQRAARAKERALRKDRARTEVEVVRLERTMRKGIGKLGRSRSGQEAIIAALEAPRALTPRQAVEVKLFDLRQTISRPRTPDEARARVAALDKEIAKGLRPLVDEAFPLAGRRREQAIRNVVDSTRGKRARRALETDLELWGIRGSRKGGGSVVADAQAQVESQIVRMAAKPDADPTVRQVAQKILERDLLQERLSDPDFVFGDAVVDLGLTGASPAAAKRLQAQVTALEKALADGTVDRPEFARALEAAETLSSQADDHARRVLGMSDEELAARRNVVASRYAERGLLPDGVEPEARGFFPHRQEFERVGAGHGGMVGIPASGGVVGRPLPGRAFESRQNRLGLYERGEVQTSPRVLSNTVRQRARYAATLEARGWLYEHGKPIRKGEPVPEGAMLVRNPKASPAQIPPSVRAAIEQPERFAELAGRAGNLPEPRTFQAWLDTWLYRGHGPEPEWLADMANVRAVPEGVVRTLLQDVFASAPRGSIASIFGSLNAFARATTIYLPYGGARYVARNTPQNLVLLALTQPKAFLQTRKSIATLRRKEPAIYQAIKAEAGTVPAAAGLPELAGMRRTRAQRLESGMTDASRRIAGGLGEVTDEPWRVASWLGYAKAYGFGSKEARRRLLTSDDPAVKRVRDDIAQRVRDDMIDFDALPPWARENLSRYLFILPFVYGSGKWPMMYLRERPAQAAILALLAAQHAREETPGRATSVLESGRTEIGGREVDLGWLSPLVPAAGTAENLVEAIEGTDTDRVEWRPLAGMLAPQYRSVVDALGYGEPTEQVARAFVPGYSTVERVREGGGPGEQALRFVGSDIRYVESGGSRAQKARQAVRLERDVVLPAVRRVVDDEDYRWVQRAYSIAERMDAIRARAREEHGDGEPYYRAVLAAEARLMGRVGVFDAEDVAWLEGIARDAPLEEVKSHRARLVSTAYEEAYLKTRRFARETAGWSS